MNPGIPRHTLTAVGNHIYARMGPPTPSPFGGPEPGGGSISSSYIIALDWSAQGKLLWMQRSSDLILPNRPADRVNRSVNFEGTPVADSRNVFVAVTDRREQTATYVACFDADTGRARWVRYLGAASSDVDNFMAMGGMGFSRTGRQRLRASAAVARRSFPLLPDEPRRGHRSRGRDRRRCAGSRIIRGKIREDGRQRPRSEPRGGPRRTGHRRSQRCCGHLRVRCRQRAAGLEDGSDRR